MLNHFLKLLFCVTPEWVAKMNRNIQNCFYADDLSALGIKVWWRIPLSKQDREVKRKMLRVIKRKMNQLQAHQRYSYSHTVSINTKELLSNTIFN